MAEDKWETIGSNSRSGGGGGGWETISKTSRATTMEGSNLNAISATGQGMTAGMLNLAGAPVDLINAGLNVVGLGSERPVGGSRQLREDVAKIPTGSVPLTYKDIKDVPETYRPLARGGEAFGASVLPGAAPFASARPIAEVNRFVRPIVQAARTSPKAFATTEAVAAFGALQGAAISELLFPGNELASFTAEIVGGLANPAGMAIKMARMGGRSATTFVKSLTPAGRAAKAAEVLQDSLIAAGEDPKAVAALLREANLENINLSAGQKAESPTLMAFETTIAGKNPSFDTAMRTKAKDNFDGMRKLLGQLEVSGDPQLLKAAGRIRERYFQSLLKGRLAAAQAQVERSLSKVTGDSAEASARANNILEDALADARKLEKAEWEKIPKDLEVPTAGTKQAFDDMVARGYAERPRPPEFVEKFVERVSSTGAKSGEMLAFRSDMLARARMARGQKNWVDAKIYEDMADGALADLAEVGTDTARQFSKSLHDVFSRTFAGEALSVTGTGADRIIPEAILKRAYGTGGAVARRRFEDLEKASQFGGKSMAAEQEEFLRGATGELIDVATGRVNPKALEKFLRTNAEMLDRYPTLKRDLGDADTAERTLQRTEAAGAKASKVMEQKAAFYEVVGQENPANAVRNIINSSNPEAGYRQLVKLAKRGPEGAVDGLKASTLEYVSRQATSSTGTFSFDKYRQILIGGKTASRKNLLYMMQKNGVMTQSEAARMQVILKNAWKIEKEVILKGKMSEVMAKPDMLFDLVVRAVGANIGGASGLAQASGASLVMAGAGVRATRGIFEKVPRTRIMDVIMEASQNPAMMAALLERPRSVQAARILERQMHGYLIQAGLTSSAEMAQEAP